MTDMSWGFISPSLQTVELYVSQRVVCVCVITRECGQRQIKQTVRNYNHDMEGTAIASSWFHDYHVKKT